MIVYAVYAVLLFIMVVLFLMSIQIVRPVEVRLVERFGMYVKTLNPGLAFIVPFIERVISVNITETMADVEPQIVITKDKLNVEVDALVYYKVSDAQKAAYNIDDYESQLIALAKTTLRAVISKMSLTEANEKRAEINQKIEEALDTELQTYGVDVLRVEIQKIEPPEDVVDAMNSVVKAEQTKIAATQLALAAQEKADGEKMAAVKTAEGKAKAVELAASAEGNAKVLIATGEAKAIELVNGAITKSFKQEAKDFKALEVAEKTMGQNMKIIVPQGSSMVNVLGDLAGISK